MKLNKVKNMWAVTLSVYSPLGFKGTTAPRVPEKYVITAKERLAEISISRVNWTKRTVTDE